MNYCDKIIKKQKGFTMAELLIYIAIASIIFIIATEVFITLTFTQKKIEARRLVDRNLEFAIKKMEQSIRDASGVNGDYPSDTLSLTVSGQTVSFYVSSGILKKQTGEDIVNLTSGDVNVSSGDTYIFSKIENPSTYPSIQIKIKVSYISNDPQLQNISNQTQTSFALRK